MPTQSFKERMKQQREQEILHAASHLIREHGYADMNMDTLAEMVGISKPTLYQHFASKEALLMRVVLFSIEALEDHLLQHTTGAPLERLKVILQTLIERAYQPDSILANLRAEPVLEVLHAGPVEEPRARVMAMLYRIVDDGKTQGQIVQMLPTPMIIKLLFFVLGAVGEYARPPGGSLDTAIQYGTQLFINAVAARSDF